MAKTATAGRCYSDATGDGNGKRGVDGDGDGVDGQCDGDAKATSASAMEGTAITAAIDGEVAAAINAATMERQQLRRRALWLVGYDFVLLL